MEEGAVASEVAEEAGGDGQAHEAEGPGEEEADRSVGEEGELRVVHVLRRELPLHLALVAAVIGAVEEEEADEHGPEAVVLALLETPLVQVHDLEALAQAHDADVLVLRLFHELGRLVPVGEIHSERRRRAAAASRAEAVAVGARGAETVTVSWL